MFDLSQHFAVPEALTAWQISLLYSTKQVSPTILGFSERLQIYSQSGFKFPIGQPDTTQEVKVQTVYSSVFFK